ncbi:GNAT family N-acetyltransferase [Marinomonas epiphytica]
MKALTSDWSSSQEQIKFVRTQVFIIEQGISPSDEWDEQDKTAIHFITFGNTAVPTGTCRLTEQGQIGRLAVLEHYRQQGYGQLLLNKAIQVAREMQMSDVFLHAQVESQAFYQQQGFLTDGKVFLSAGKLHVKMTRRI